MEGAALGLPEQYNLCAGAHARFKPRCFTVVCQGVLRRAPLGCVRERPLRWGWSQQIGEGVNTSRATQTDGEAAEGSQAQRQLLSDRSVHVKGVTW